MPGRETVPDSRVAERIDTKHSMKSRKLFFPYKKINK